MYESLAEHFTHQFSEEETESLHTDMLLKSGKAELSLSQDTESMNSHLWTPTKSEIWIMITLAVCSLVVALDATILVPVLPTLAADLKGTSSDAFWTGTSYLLAHSVLQPFIATISGVFGRRNLLVPSVIFFAVGSAICGVAQNFTIMLLGRVLQGVGGAGIIALAQVIFADMIPLRQRPKYFTMILASWALGSLLGPLIGGTIVQKLNWRWCFFLNLPICCVALPMALVFLRGLKAPNANLSTKLRSIDWVGNALFISSLTLLLIAISWAGIQYAWTAWQTVAPLSLGIVGVLVTIAYERFLASHPFLQKQIFNSPSAIASYVAAMFQGLVLFMGLYYVSFYFSTALFFSPIKTGVSIFPATAFMLPGAALVSMLITRTGKFRWAIWTGYVIATLSCSLFLLWDDNTKTAVWAVCLSLFGIGMGMILSSVNVSVQANVQPEDAGQAAVMYAFMRSIGMSIGVAVGGTVFQNVMKSKLVALGVPQAEELAKNAEGYVHELMKMAAGETKTNIMASYISGFHGIWISMTGLCAAGLLVSLLIKRGDMDKALTRNSPVRQGDNV